MEIPKSSFLKATALGVSAATALATGGCGSPTEGEWKQLPPDKKIETITPPEGLDARQRTLGVYVVTIMQNGEPIRDHGYDKPEKVEEIMKEATHDIAESTLGVEQIDAKDMGSHVVKVETSKKRCYSEDLWFEFIKDAGKAARLHAQMAGKNPDDAEHDLFLVDIKNCADTGKRQPDGLPVKSGIIGLADSTDKASYVFYGPTAQDVTKHELGHLLGLGHSGSQYCTNLEMGKRGESIFTGKETCEVMEYGDSNSTMGNANLWEQPDIFNGPQLAQLGAIKPEQIVDVTGSGEYEINSLLKPDATGSKILRVKALRTKIRSADGPLLDDPYYWIELSSVQPAHKADPECETVTVDEEECFETNNVSVKVYLAPQEMVEKPDGFTDNITIMPLYPGQGLIKNEAGLDKTGRKLFTEQYGGKQMDVSLLNLDPDWSGTASSGRAIIKIEFGETKALENYLTGDARDRYIRPVDLEE